MAKNQSDVLASTLDSMFSESDMLQRKQGSQQRKKTASVSKRDLEVALTVLLVDLASCDQNFDPREYQMIANGLRRMFGTAKHEVQSLVNQAKIVMANLRGTNKFAELLRKNLDTEQRQAIMKIIDDIILSDGVEDGFETYLRCKFADLLGTSSES